MSGTTVCILGAGCSVKYGYPLAAGFLPALESFSSTLGGDAQKLKRSVDETVALMRQASAQTIDELAFRIHQGVLDDPNHDFTRTDSVRRQRILKAKIATDAFFLALEQRAKGESLDGYQRLILKMFPGSGDWRPRFRKTNYRLLTFNYDRLFEMALLRMFGIEPCDGLFYGADIVNSGLNNTQGQGMGFAADRFTFLKLHGSIGMRIQEDSFGSCYLPDFDGTMPGEVIAINDDTFLTNLDNSNPHERDPQPLIVFPFEKDFVLSGSDNKLPFREYVDAVWQQAKRVVEAATEIRFIGYSFHPMDHDSVIGLLKEARRCRKLVIQNRPGEAKRICETLRVDYGIEIPLEPYDCEF